MATKEQRKVYTDLAYMASMESVKRSMLIRKLEAEKTLLNAMVAYYDDMANLEYDNSQFGFDLNS